MRVVVIGSEARRGGEEVGESEEVDGERGEKGSMLRTDSAYCKYSP